METISTQQEILLITGTSFSQRNWSEKNVSDRRETDLEQLEKACWNGLMKELLPEIFEKSSDGKELYLWNIVEAESFIGLDLSEYPGPIEKADSINPYYFLSEQFYN
ncbi:MAG TPA: hypothetical protein VMH01_09005 [Puia sp.]|nr:hypothetical protein [Puia sp.]